MLSKKPEITSNFQRDIIVTDSARNAWKIILSKLQPNSRILLPSYIGITDREGSGIYDPVSSLKVEHDFYGLGFDLSIELDKLKLQLEQGKYDLLLVVHYFGFQVENIAEIAKLCKAYGVILVEDCAHLYNINLVSKSRAGLHGDMSFYSLHKNFPIKEGGLLVINNNCLDIEIVKPSKPDYRDIFLTYDTNAIADKRIENYKYLRELLKEVKGITSFKSLNDGDIPHNYPILVSNKLRERLYFWLIDKNIHLIALYYRLIPQLNNPENTRMIDLSNNILNLPIHQDVEKEELIGLVKLLQEGIKELNS